jgi:hypothetical protein
MTTTAVLSGVPGILTAREVADTAEHLARCQLSSGLIAWFEGGHADPWNHVECAMALTAAGRGDAASAAYEWLARHQLGDGSWFNYYVGDAVKDARLDANVCAYVATGVYHHLLVTGDLDVAAGHWPMVERAMEFVIALQRRDGAITWSLDRTGRRESYSLLTGSSSIFRSLRCAVALAERLDHHRPAWELAAGRLGHAIARHPDTFAPKEEFAMDWYYPVLSGAVTGESARQRLDEGWSRYVLDDYGVRCVATHDWVTAAETAETALALDAAGAGDLALATLAHTARHRRPDGSYLTGIVYPQRDTFPRDETSSYTAAAILLAVDALSNSTAAAGLFRPGALVETVEWPEAGCSRE